jgi:hypothetical protein
MRDGMHVEPWLYTGPKTPEYVSQPHQFYSYNPGRHSHQPSAAGNHLEFVKIFYIVRMGDLGEKMFRKFWVKLAFDFVAYFIEPSKGWKRSNRTLLDGRFFQPSHLMEESIVKKYWSGCFSIDWERPAEEHFVHSLCVLGFNRCRSSRIHVPLALALLKHPRLQAFSTHNYAREGVSSAPNTVRSYALQVCDEMKWEIEAPIVTDTTHFVMNQLTIRTAADHGTILAPRSIALNSKDPLLSTASQKLGSTK